MKLSPRLLLLLVACTVAGLSVGQLTVRLRQADPVPLTGPAMDAPEMLPAIQLSGLDGQPLALSQWDGRTRVINFWATWCPPCRREMPLFQAVAESRDAEDLVVIGIAIDRLDAVNRFVAEFGITYPQLVGEQDAIAAADLFGVQSGGLPFTVFAAPGGEILHLHVGELDGGELHIILTVADQVSRGEVEVREARERLSRL